MNSLFYLLFCDVKNSLRETVRKPARLALYVFAIFIIVLGLVVNAKISRNPAEFKDIHLLGGIFFALLTAMLLLYISQAFKLGSSLFQMSDVNLLFVSPVSPQKILIYGIAKTIKNASIAGIFILFQGGTLGRTFGAGPSSLLLILGMFALSFCLAEISAIIIYSVTSGNPARRRIAKAAIALVFLPIVLTIFTAFIREGDTAAALLYACKSPALQLTPVSGWGAAALLAFHKGQWLTCGLFVALTAGAIAGLAALLLRLKSDYYEDTLVATERVFAAKRAAEESKLGMAEVLARKIKVAETGLSGFGARALFGKQLRETFRGSRLGFIDIRTFFYTASAAAAAVAFIKLGVPGNPLLLILQYFAMLQAITVAMSPSLRELHTHCIYLIPEPPLAKLVWNSLPFVLKSCVESILVLGIAGIILRENPLIIAGAILASAMFALMLAGIIIFGLRWASVNLSAGVLTFLNMMIAIIALLPGLIPAFIAAIVIKGNAGIAAALAIVSLWEIFAAFVCFALSKGILDNCDMPTAKR